MSEQLLQPADGDYVTDDIHVARGDLFLDDGDEQRVKSELPEVSNEAWALFVEFMAVAPLSAVSDSNALGTFQIMPRRLADFGMVTKLRRARSPQNRTIWVAEFVPPMTCARFLRSLPAQYEAFTRSMQDYAARMSSGEIDRGDMSLSGALAILHRAGPRGLEAWKGGERFPSTEVAYERVAGVF